MAGVGCVASSSTGSSSVTVDNTSAADGAGLPAERFCPEVNDVAAEDVAVELDGVSVLESDCAPPYCGFFQRSAFV